MQNFDVALNISKISIDKSENGVSAMRLNKNTRIVFRSPNFSLASVTHIAMQYY